MLVLPFSVRRMFDALFSTIHEHFADLTELHEEGLLESLLRATNARVVAAEPTFRLSRPLLVYVDEDMDLANHLLMILFAPWLLHGCMYYQSLIHVPLVQMRAKTAIFTRTRPRMGQNVLV